MRDGVQQRGCDSRASPVDCARDARGVRAGRLADSRRRRGLDTCRYLHKNDLSGPIPDLSRLSALTKALLLGNNFLGGIGTECTSASKTLLLEGAAVQPAMGLYTEISVTVDNDYAQRDGRPVFFGQGQYLFYYSTHNAWLVGLSLGSTTAVMYVVSAAQHPTAITGAWIEEDGSNGWVGAPNLKVTCLRQ